MAQNKEQLKFMANQTYPIELLYDTPFEGESKYGKYFTYTVKHEDSEKIIFATEALHKKLDYYRTGDKVTVQKKEYEPNKFGWDVIPDGDTQYRGQQSKESHLATPSATEKEKRTYFQELAENKSHDIHRQVCFKIACDMIDTKNKVLTDGELTVITANTDSLLNVLEGKHTTTEEEVPF